ncbi:BsuPI-related putative proteinase inhibitor [Bacillus sp. MRMR6]|uniref:BsuPI-related putative proteinase inhibitor n=1 Tax=Bacillus sp. MRMR6 TaxID=1928617 RepID=UPI0009523E8B|nr:BsuPI-related putative proteinase inhibitor [Bacillus sp. MRMR6]OLS40659.1 hypothetical protein BTR25_07105 [Bacillus sp. MRMR6]
MKLSKKVFSILALLCLAAIVLFSYTFGNDKSAIGKGSNETPSEQEEQVVKPPASEEDTGGVNTGGIVAGDMMSGLVDLGNGKFQYQVKNQTEKEITLEFTSSQRFDYAVYKENGEQIYLFSSVALFMMALGEEILLPGDELNYEFDLTELGLEKGKYTVEAWLTPKGGENYKILMDYIVE